MSKLGIWAEVEAKPGKGQTVAEFLKSAQALAEKEQRTITSYAVKLGGAKFGIFDTLAYALHANSILPWVPTW